MEIIDLDECVLNALELFSKGLPELDLTGFRKPLVVGSGNSAVTGRLLFEGTNAVYADEGTFRNKVDSVPDIDGALLISASGGKHAPIIAKELKSRDKTVYLLTCNENAQARKFADKTIVSPKNAEPYTYNTSTYMGMILSKTGEDPGAAMDYLKAMKVPQNLEDYDAFYMIVPTEFDNVRELFQTKFDELFGGVVNGRVFTPEQTKHAKTVVPYEKELFVSFGYHNDEFGLEGNRLNYELPANCGPATMMAIGYYFIGQIQKQHPDYFKDNIGEYVQKASELFGEKIDIITT